MMTSVIEDLSKKRQLNWVTCTGRGGGVISATRLSHYADWEGTDGSVMTTEEVMSRKITEQSSFDSAPKKIPNDVHMIRFINHSGYEGVGINVGGNWSLTTITPHTSVTVSGILEEHFEIHGVDKNTIIPYKPVL